MERTRLLPGRFKRIWALVEFIAAHPGAQRKELAQHFGLSERQLQADLRIVREDMGFPLIRAEGYRLAGAASVGSRELTLRDAHTLFLLVQGARNDGTATRQALSSLGARLAEAFPTQLQPLVRRVLGVDRRGKPPGELLAALLDALVRRQATRLRFPPGAGLGYLTDPIVEPELLLPYRGSWYLIGWCRQQDRRAMVSLDALRSVDEGPPTRPTS